MTIQLLVIAKEPVPGRVKTRLCPPCTPGQAAAIAAAALTDTLAACSAFPAVRRTVVLDSTGVGDTTHGGDIASEDDTVRWTLPDGWRVVPQHGDGLGERLANAFRDTAMPRVVSLLIGMDTPQVTAALLTEVADLIRGSAAVLAPAHDGGWWALALRDPGDARVLAGVPMSTATTGDETMAALVALGRSVAVGPALSDVDTAADALAIAKLCPDGLFAAAVTEHAAVPA